MSPSLPNSLAERDGDTAAHIDVVPGSGPWFHLARRAKFLAALTLLWLGIEGTIGIVAGIMAGSIALIAFGLDSAIEGLASVIIIWRFTGTRTISADAERRAQKWVAISFFMLAPYVAAEALETLIEGAVAETSWLGIALTAGTLVLCPWLGRAKQRIGEQLDSRATYGEGTQNVLCAILAGAVLVGLAANSLFGLWWLDPAIALAISAVCVREGQKAWRGEQCSCATCS
jgi:divalent metal cation (Fe/Co/Zn/Cd) transporter